jgi:hypothetical protein
MPVEAILKCRRTWVSGRFRKFLNSSYRSRGSSVSIVTWLRAGRSAVRMLTGPKTPRPAMRPTQYPFQKVQGVKWPAHDVDHSHVVPMLRIGGAVPPLTLCTFVLCVGTTLPSFLRFVTWLSDMPAQWVCLFVVSVVMQMSMCSILSGVLVCPGRFLERTFKCIIFASFQILNIQYHPSSVFAV